MIYKYSAMQFRCTRKFLIICLFDDIFRYQRPLSRELGLEFVHGDKFLLRK